MLVFSTLITNNGDHTTENNYSLQFSCSFTCLELCIDACQQWLSLAGSSMQKKKKIGTAAKTFRKNCWQEKSVKMVERKVGETEDVVV